MDDGDDGGVSLEATSAMTDGPCRPVTSSLIIDAQPALPVQLGQGFSGSAKIDSRALRHNRASEQLPE